MLSHILAALVAAQAPQPATAAPDSPLAAQVLSGEENHYLPWLRYAVGGARLEARVQASLRTEQTSRYPVDRDGVHIASRTILNPRLRLSASADSADWLDSVRLQLEYEHDLPTGGVLDARSLDGSALPGDRDVSTALRKLYGRVLFGRLFHIGGGMMTSHWGLGLLANDGAHGWTPGSAYFSDPRGGDRVLRAFLGTGPHTPLDAVLTLAVDKVRDDGTLLTADELSDNAYYASPALSGVGTQFPPVAGDGDQVGDDAVQAIAALQLGYDRPTAGGVYVVYREQETADGRTLNALVGDVAGRTRFDLHGWELELGAEAVLVSGETNLAGSGQRPEHRVMQLGAAGRGRLDLGGLGVVLDILYASGDQNIDDRRQNAFRANVNYDMGMLLFDQVVAAQTGRATATAGNPDLVGLPAPGVERLPTRGAATNTIAIFPRAWWRPIDGLETYGGPLFAFAEVPPVDPLNTRLAGGSPRDALDGEPGRYWGTELDVGVRYRALLAGTELTAGLEAGVLIPGSALAGSGASMDPVWGGRFLFDYRL